MLENTMKTKCTIHLTIDSLHYFEDFQLFKSGLRCMPHPGLGAPSSISLPKDGEVSCLVSHLDGQQSGF